MEVISSYEEFQSLTGVNLSSKKEIITDILLFSCHIKINIELNNFKGKIIIENCIFENRFTLNDCHIIDNFNVINSEFKGILFINKSELNSSINEALFFGCTFHESFKLSANSKMELTNIDCDVHFEACKFLKTCNLTYSIFHGNSKFINCQFEDTRFHNTIFLNSADFYGSVFNRSTILLKTEFQHNLILSKCIFHENLLFTYSVVNESIILTNTVFQKGLDLSLCQLNGNLNPFLLDLRNFKSTIHKIDAEEFSTEVTERGNISHKSKRETFRILKQSFISQGNNIEALKFHKLEYNAFFREVRSEIFHFYKKWPPLRYLFDFVILLINWSTNNFNTSWSRSAAFTILVTILIYSATLSTILPDENQCSAIYHSTLENFGRLTGFFLPTHKPNLLLSSFGLTSAPWQFYLYDFLGRIFISLGIYQTVAAFRKYKR